MRLFVAVVFTSCLLAPVLDAWAQKQDKDERYNEALQLVESGEFIFIADWAYPQKGRQINLMSNPNYLLLEGSQASADLPYFGVVTSGSAGYGSAGGGIKFNTEFSDFSIEKNDKKRRATVKFKAREGTEVFICVLTVSSMTSVNLSITGSNRQLIRYRGKISAE